MDYLLPGYVIGDYVIVEQIGSGAFSTVYRARHTAGRFDAALKLISKHTNIEGAHQLYENEVKVLKMAQDFPFIVHFYEAFEIPSFFVISMEYLENGSVADNIYQFNSKSGFIDIEPLKIFNQVIAAIDFLHNTLHIIHCDIKSENVMLDASGNARLSDFGLAKIFDPENEDKIEQVAGSLKAIAPEQFKRGYTCPKSDLWSAGILLYELVYNKLPYNDNCMTSLAKKIMYQGLHFPADSPNAPLLGSAYSSACSSARSNACSSANSSACSSARSNSSSNDGTPKFSCDVDKRREEIKDLITEMLQKDPKERISYQDILDHPCMNRETIKTHSKIDEFRKLNIEQYDLPDKAKKIEEFSEEKYHFVGFENKYLELQQLSLPISSSKDSVIKGTPTIHNGKRLRLKKKAKVMRSYHAISANAALGMTPIQRPGFKPT